MASSMKCLIDTREQLFDPQNPCEKLDVVVYTRNLWGGRDRMLELSGQSD